MSSNALFWEKATALPAGGFTAIPTVIRALPTPYRQVRFRLVIPKLPLQSGRLPVGLCYHPGRNPDPT